MNTASDIGGVVDGRETTLADKAILPGAHNLDEVRNDYVTQGQKWIDQGYEDLGVTQARVMGTLGRRVSLAHVAAATYALEQAIKTGEGDVQALYDATKQAQWGGLDLPDQMDFSGLSDFGQANMWNQMRHWVHYTAEGGTGGRHMDMKDVPGYTIGKPRADAPFENEALRNGFLYNRAPRAIEEGKPTPF